MKRFFASLLLITVLIFMAGCSANADLTGTWEQEIEISILGVGSGTAVRSVCRFVFREDGTGTREQIIPDGSHPTASREFTYRMEDSTITLDYGDNQTETFTVSLEKNLLKLENRRGVFELTKT